MEETILSRYDRGELCSSHSCLATLWGIRDGPERSGARQKDEKKKKKSLLIQDRDRGILATPESTRIGKDALRRTSKQGAASVTEMVELAVAAGRLDRYTRAWYGVS